MVSITEFQKMMKEVYYIRDRKRGAKGTYSWLKDEVEELWEAMQTNNKKSIEDEFADVIAWLASLANILDIDLEKVAFRKYNNCCPKCNSSPCRCPQRAKMLPTN